MQVSAHYQLRIAHKPRIFAYFLASLMVGHVFLATGFTLAHLCFLLALFGYPHLLHFLCFHLANNSTGARACLLVDAFTVGCLTGIVGFDLQASVVLSALLIVSVIIIGGPKLLLLSIPLFTSGFALVFLFAGNRAADVAGFDVVSFTCLLGYTALIAWLVYRETKRLNVEHRHETTKRLGLEQLRAKIAPFVAPQIIGRDVNPAGPTVRSRLTVFFSDIEGFTRLMDQGDEARIAGLLNDYFESMTSIADAHGGTVDKFIGDGVMIFFGDPESAGPVADAYACVSMALEMRTRFKALSASWKMRLGGEAVHLRIGIDTGYCTVGYFGSAARMDYTALGSTVNKASRLEGLAGRDEILVSEDTWQLLRPWVNVKPRGHIRLKGISRPMPAYAVESLACSLPGNIHLLPGAETRVQHV